MHRPAEPPEPTPSVTPLPLTITHGPCLQAPTESSVYVFWTTDRPCASHVEYGEHPGLLMKKAVATRHGLIDANTKLHSIPLRNLKPGMTYSYRVVSREILDFGSNHVTFGQGISTGEMQFTTLDRSKKQFSFLTFNDRHDKADLFSTDLAATDFKGVDLVFLNGDILSKVRNEEQIFNSLIDPATNAFAKRIPFVFVRGNHETRGAYARHLFNYTPTGCDHYYRSFDHGPVHFTILDGGEDKNDDHVEYSGLVCFESYIEQQTEWLKEEVRSYAFRNAPFRVIFLHILPRLGSKPDRTREKWLLKNWVPILNDAKADLMLSGHTHVPAQVPITAGYNNFPIVVVGTQAVLRADVTPERIELTTIDMNHPMPVLKVVRRGD